MGGAQLFDLLIDRFGSGDVAETQIAIEGFGIDSPGLESPSPQGLEFGCEGEDCAIVYIIQGLLANPVPAQEHDLFPCVPDGKGEHAEEFFDAMLAPSQIGYQDHFRVASSCESVAPGLKFGAYLQKVIYFSVKD